MLQLQPESQHVLAHSPHTEAIQHHKNKGPEIARSGHAQLLEYVMLCKNQEISKSKERKPTQKRDSSHAELRAFLIVVSFIREQGDFYLLYIDHIHIAFFYFFFRLRIGVLGRSSAVQTGHEAFVVKCQCSSCSRHICLARWSAGSLFIFWMDAYNVFRRLQHNYAEILWVGCPPTP